MEGIALDDCGPPSYKSVDEFRISVLALTPQNEEKKIKEN